MNASAFNKSKDSRIFKLNRSSIWLTKEQQQRKSDICIQVVIEIVSSFHRGVYPCKEGTDDDTQKLQQYEVHKITLSRPP